MSYTLSIGLCWASQTGLSLRAKLVQTNGSLGGEISSGFVEIGSGFYLWTYADFPADFRGGVKFYPNGQEMPWWPFAQ